MIQIHKFTFNPFQENTYIIYDETKECIIIDPGCFNTREEEELTDFVADNELKPVKLLNTHAHIDHVLGNLFVSEKYELEIMHHFSEHPVWEMAIRSAELYNIPYKPSPEPSIQLKEDDVVSFGNSNLDVLFVPGHSPDHIVLINKEDKIMLGGDVLFHRSIGRTDLPGGNHDELIENIKNKIFTLEDDIVVYSGHGPETSIGFEKRNNPFF